MTGKPTAKEVNDKRTFCGLTQEQAAALVHSHWKTWQAWEAGKAKMPVAKWELFNLKVAFDERDS